MTHLQFVQCSYGVSLSSPYLRRIVYWEIMSDSVFSLPFLWVLLIELCHCIVLVPVSLSWWGSSVRYPLSWARLQLDPTLKAPLAAHK